MKISHKFRSEFSVLSNYQVVDEDNRVKSVHENLWLNK